MHQFCSRSTVFERMLKADMVEAQTGEVVTQDIEEKTMEKLLEFIYTGEIDNMGDQLEQPLPLTATANEVFKHAKRLGYGEHDTSAVYIRARF